MIDLSPDQERKMLVWIELDPDTLPKELNSYEDLGAAVRSAIEAKKGIYGRVNWCWEIEDDSRYKFRVVVRGNNPPDDLEIYKYDQPAAWGYSNERFELALFDAFITALEQAQPGAE